MDAKQFAHLTQILDSWGPGIPDGLTATREGDAALFRDKDGVLRMVMHWEDYEAILKWHKEKHE